MSYEIITPDGKTLHFRVHVDCPDTLENRKVAHKIRVILDDFSYDAKSETGEKDEV